MNICKFPSTSSNKKGRLHQINEICPLMFVKIFLIQVCTQQSANHNLSISCGLIFPGSDTATGYGNTVASHFQGQSARFATFQCSLRITRLLK